MQRCRVTHDVLTLPVMLKYTFHCRHALHAFGFFHVPPFPLFLPAAETGRYNNFSVQNRRTTKLSNVGIKSTEVTISLCKSPVRDSPLGTRSVLTQQTYTTHRDSDIPSKLKHITVHVIHIVSTKMTPVGKSPIPPNSSTYSCTSFALSRLCTKKMSAAKPKN